MSRRGSIRKEANGTWSLVVDVPAGADRRRQLRRRGFTTRREAQAALVDLLATLQRGTFVRPEKVRLGEYLAAWMDSLETSGRSPATVSSYRHTLRLHVVPYLGDVQLQALEAVDLDRLYRRLLESGRRNGAGGGLSHRTVRYVHIIVSAALSDAVAKDLLRRNPAAAATPPAAAATRAQEMAWWRPEKLQAFLSFVDGHELATLFRLAAVTGMRRGEVVGLRWIDVDLETSGRVPHEPSERLGEGGCVMTGLLSTHRTSELPWASDTSLLDVAALSGEQNARPCSIFERASTMLTALRSRT